MRNIGTGAGWCTFGVHEIDLPRCAMDRHALAARILKIDGILLLLVAVIHFAATPFALGFVSGESTPEAFAQVKPPFLLCFIVVGVLLLPIGLSTAYCADFFRRG